MSLPTGSKKGQRLTLPFPVERSCRCSLLEGEPGRKLNDTAGNRGGGDRTHGWIGSVRSKNGRIEVVAGISEAWMVQDVDSIHPKLQFAFFPPRQPPSLAQ